jgi:hypothetical protein
MELLRDIAMIEAELNLLKRELQIVNQNYNVKKSQLLQLTRITTTGERHTELIRQMVDLSSHWRQETWRLNEKINVRTLALNSKKCQLK